MIFYSLLSFSSYTKTYRIPCKSISRALTIITREDPSMDLRKHNKIGSKKLILMFGWLGCQLKSLKRYISMYENLGCDVITRIPSPYMVAQAAFLDSRVQNNTETSLLFKTMNEMAIETIDTMNKYIITTQDNEIEIYLHVFSNGGCFLWENIHDIFLIDTDNSDYAYIQSKLKGIVYDSAPCSFHSGKGNLLLEAIKYCSPSEQKLLRETILIDKSNGGEQIRKNDNRAMEYWTKMKTSPLLQVRSLYIFSKTDPLAPFQELKDLVLYREKEFGKQKVKYLIYEDSPHCSHLLTDPKRYTTTINDFLFFGKCNIEGQLHSRL